MASQIRVQSYESFFKPKRQFGKRTPNGFPIGVRTERRQKENRELNKLEVRECEIQIKGICLRNRFLTWAHRVKARFLVTSKDWQEAARCCLACHQRIEAMSHKEMATLVGEAIKRRILPNGIRPSVGPNHTRITSATKRS